MTAPSDTSPGASRACGASPSIATILVVVEVFLSVLDVLQILLGLGEMLGLVDTESEEEWEPIPRRPWWPPERR